MKEATVSFEDLFRRSPSQRRKICGDLTHAVNKDTNAGFPGFIRRHYADDENPEHASQLARIGNRSRRTFVTNAPASRGLRVFTHFIHPVNVYRDRVRDGDVGHTR